MSPEETQRLRRSLQSLLGAPKEGFKVTRDPASGMLRLDPGNRFPSATVVARAPDGTRRVGCVSSAAELDALMAPRAPGDLRDSRRKSP